MGLLLEGQTVPMLKGMGSEQHLECKLVNELVGLKEFGKGMELGQW